jgi:hypothetical protein
MPENNPKEILEKKLKVPCYSQFLEVSDSFWNIRSCGGACIKMVLDYYNQIGKIEKNNKSILEIMEEAKEMGGYHSQNGFIHDYAVEYFVKNGLQSYRKEGLESIDEVINNLDNNNPVLVSVVKKTLEQTKFHLILVVGYKYYLGGGGEKIITQIIYHEPEAVSLEGGSFRVCDLEVFKNSWRSKAIFVSDK